VPGGPLTDPDLTQSGARRRVGLQSWHRAAFAMESLPHLFVQRRRRSRVVLSAITESATRR
jgi:hypothetical protein